MMKINLAFLLLSLVAGNTNTSGFIANFRDHFEKKNIFSVNFEKIFLSGIHCLHVETTPAREVCTAFECPNDNEEGGLFQVEL